MAAAAAPSSTHGSNVTNEQAERMKANKEAAQAKLKAAKVIPCVPLHISIAIALNGWYMNCM